jgi:hypothetical protein
MIALHHNGKYAHHTTEFMVHRHVKRSKKDFFLETTEVLNCNRRMDGRCLNMSDTSCKKGYQLSASMQCVTQNGSSQSGHAQKTPNSTDET